MKLLKEIDQRIYETDRNTCAEPENGENQDTLFIARFWAPKLAVEGLVSVHSVDGDKISFQHATDDGEPVGTLYDTQINGSGIIGALTLRDGRVLRAREGYLKQFDDSLDDLDKEEFAKIVAEHERNLLPVHVTLGGEASDIARRELARLMVTNVL